MGSAILDGLNTEYRKNPTEQTDGGTKPLSVSEVGYISVAKEAKNISLPPHQREWGSRGDFMATDQIPLPRDAHYHYYDIRNISEMEKIER